MKCETYVKNHGRSVNKWRNIAIVVLFFSIDCEIKDKKVAAPAGLAGTAMPAKRKGTLIITVL